MLHKYDLFVYQSSLYLFARGGHHLGFLALSVTFFASRWSRPLTLGKMVIFCLLLQFNETIVWRPALGSGIRFGEAKHPGPPMQSIRFCVTNPTSLTQKADMYIDLANIHECDVISLSETAATDITQRNFSKLVGKHKLRCHWSPPVQPFRNTITGKPHEKGRASGVCLCTTLPFRPCRNKFDAKWIASTRIIHSIVKAGNLHIQVLTLYCKPTSSGAAVIFNQELMNYVMTQIELVPLPFIIMGDFNMDLDRFDCWPALESKGCRCLPQLHQRLMGTPMPATCKDVTIPDNAIISSTLVPFVTRVQVLKDTGIPTHHPVIFDLSLPAQGLFRHRINFPRQFTELGLDEADFDNAYNIARESLPLPNSIEEWGHNLDSLADIAIQNCPKMHKQGVHSLPLPFKGRCRIKQVTKCPVQSSTKKGWNGVFEPSTEVLTMATRRKITQLRRIQSLMRRLFKLEAVDHIPDNTTKELRSEWVAIHRSTAMGKPFLFWIQDFPDITLPTYPMPGANWLHDVAQLVQHIVESDLQLDKKYFQDSLKYQRHVDQKYASSKNAFKQIRGNDRPPLTEIKEVIQDLVKVIPLEDSHHIEIFGEFTKRLSLQFPVSIGDLSARVLAIEEDAAILDLGEETWTGAEDAHLTQHVFSCDPLEIANQLNSFWLPIWQKDEPCDNLEQDVPDLRAITQYFPAHSAIAIDMQDPDLWMAAIKKQKAGSARGIDAVSSQELKLLPKGFIATLAHVMTLYPRGFPEWFMTAFTCPLPKNNNLPEGSGTRPITILSQLYRTWAAVATTQIVKVIAHWVPTGVTGLLPSRGASDCAYRAQFELELAAKERNRCSGLVMDLKKCFNNIRWVIGFNLLLDIGVPIQILRIWIHSIANLSRYWVLQGDYFYAGFSTGGFPEGDSWSVIVMVALAAAWVSFLEHTIPTRSQPCLSAYADNWSWTLQEMLGHHIAMTNTCRLITLAGLSIDWTKTWFWATSNADARQISDMLVPFSSPHRVLRCHSANDLGYQMQYSGCPVLGNILTRFENGLQRLDRLTGMPHSLDVKEHLVLSSVLPAAFHGAETRPISGDRVNKFRSRVAAALFGTFHSLTPVIALLLTGPCILDPEFWLILQSFRAARKFLFRTSDEKKNAFFRIASLSQGGISKVRGPAATFSFYLKQLGWSICSAGKIHPHAFMTFDFLRISFKRLVRFAILSWQEKLVTMHTHRFKLFSFPDIDRASTVAVLKHFSPRQRRHLITDIAGGYQTQHQKHKWATDAEPNCIFCGEPDSKEHKVLYCTMFSSVRESHQEVVEHLTDSDLSLTELPVCFLNPTADLLLQLQFRNPPPIFSDMATQFVQKRRSEQIPVCWYTDGSCFHPANPLTRFSAFAIILDIAEDDETRAFWGRQCAPLNLIPPTLTRAAVGRTCGEQDILRAELSAIYHIMIGPAYGIIYTDSSAAIHLIQTTLCATSISQFSHLEHFDLLLAIWEARNCHTCTLRKIKAHLEPTSFCNPVEAYQCLGNKLANDTAQQINISFCSSLVSELENFHTQNSAEKQRLKQVFSLLLALTEARQKLPLETNAPQVMDITVDQVCQSFLDWSISTPLNFSPELDVRFLGDTILGLQVAQQTLEWLSKFVWPRDTMGPQKDGVGTSWIELVTSWMMYHRRYFPVHRPSCDGYEVVITPGGYDAAKDLGVTLSELGCMFQAHLQNLQALVPQTLTPDFRRGKVASLYMLGYKQFTTGINLRPVIPCQREVVGFLHSFLQVNSIDVTPQVQSTLTDNLTLNDHWQKRQLKSHSTRKKVAKVRKAHC